MENSAKESLAFSERWGDHMRWDHAPEGFLETALRATVSTACGNVLHVLSSMGKGSGVVDLADDMPSVNFLQWTAQK